MTVITPRRPGTGSGAQVGRSMPRVDAAEKLRGEARYVGDMSVPGMLWGKVLRSPVPHARIASIDASAALARPGVVAVLTGADLLDLDPFWGHAIRERRLRCSKPLRPPSPSTRRA